MLAINVNLVDITNYSLSNFRFAQTDVVFFSEPAKLLPKFLLHDAGHNASYSSSQIVAANTRKETDL